MSSTAPDGEELLRVDGLLDADGIQILASRVDGARLELPRDTTGLRVAKGHVSATVTLDARLTTECACTATLGIDADADGDIAPHEACTVRADGRDVRSDVPRDRGGGVRGGRVGDRRAAAHGAGVLTRGPPPRPAPRPGPARERRRRPAGRPHHTNGFGG